MSDTKRKRIDVHHHPVLTSHLTHMGRNSANPGALKNWTVQKSLDDMGAGGIDAAVLSLPYPPEAWVIDGKDAAKLAREGNEFMAQLARDHRGKYGVFATLPINHIDASLKEAEYAFDTLGVDGIGMMTNLGERWLGDPHYAPLFEELNRRKAVVFVHPAAPFCCTNLVPDIPDTMIEFATDTSRAIGRMIFSGAAARFPDIRFIFSHGGGTMPFIAERYIRMPSLSPSLKERVPNGVEHELRKFYYELAQASYRSALAALTPLVPFSQLLFGTDHPFRKASEHMALLREFGFGDAEIDALTRGNPAVLLPRLSAL
jgi:predicted TIM-barrel fold metal-dependent hydrolase